jgi:hypothetical protein
METLCFSETSVDFQRYTRRYVPNTTLLNDHCENFKSYFSDFVTPCFQQSRKINKKLISIKQIAFKQGASFTTAVKTSYILNDLTFTDVKDINRKIYMCISPDLSRKKIFVKSGGEVMQI